LFPALGRQGPWSLKNHWIRPFIVSDLSSK
jgi:hypothetical protein